MEDSITFFINIEDKNKLKSIAEKDKLSLSAYIRYNILKLINQEENKLLSREKMEVLNN